MDVEALVVTLAAVGSLVAAAALAGPVHAGSDGTEASPVELKVGETFQAPPHPSRTPTRYAVPVPTQGSYLIEVTQLGLDYVVWVTLPDGTDVTVDSPLERYGNEVVLLEHVEPGSYRIEVRSGEFTRAAGSHRIQISQLADPAGSRELVAWRSMTDAARANHTAGRAGWGRAAAEYRKAAAAWTEISRPREAAIALLAEGRIAYLRDYDWNRAVELAERAITSRAGGDLELLTRARFQKAEALMEVAAGSATSQPVFAQTRKLLEEVREFHASVGDEFGVAVAINNVGLSWFYQDEYERAAEYFSAAESHYLAAGETYGAHQALMNQAAAQSQQGMFVKAIPSYERALAMLPEAGMDAQRAVTMDNLAIAHAWTGDTDEAARVSLAAREIHRHLEENGDLYSLMGLGNAYFKVGEFERAADLLEQALARTKEVDDPRVRNAALRMLGDVAFGQRRTSEALSYHRRAYELANTDRNRAHLQLALAKDLNVAGDIDQARDRAEQAWAIASNATSDRVLLAETAESLGHLNLEQHHFEEAERNFRQALDRFEELRLRRGQAQALLGLALVAGRRGDLDRAINLGNSAIELVESERARVADPGLRAFYSASTRQFYEFQIATLMAPPAPGGQQQDRTALALSVSERARSRMTLELIEEAAARRDNDGGSTRLDELYGQMAALRRRLREAEAEETPRLEEKLSELTVTVDVLRSRSRTGSEALRVTPMTSTDIQASLDPDSVLLQYVLGEHASYVWVVTRDRLAVAQLPPRAVIEAAARQAFEALSHSGRQNAASRELDTLSELVIDPVAGQLHKPRVIVAADGALHYVPFSVLSAADADGRRRPVIEQFDVVHVNSMSVLQRQRARESTQRRSAAVAVFADPIFQLSDSRIEPQELGTAVFPGSEDARLTDDGLVRLPGSAREAEAIAERVDSDGSLIATGVQASVERLVKEDLRRFGVLHFATHAQVDTRYPQLSALMLSRFDENGHRLNGRMHVYDVSNLRLNADLVVLSACETALGREITGEGLVGFSQSFISAGTSGLIMSLWQVPDRATAELMSRFYGNLFDRGLDVAQALRDAQRQVAAQRRWRNPYYWGAFVLVGEWRRPKLFHGRENRAALP